VFRFELILVEIGRGNSGNMAEEEESFIFGYRGGRELREERDKFLFVY